MIHYHVVERYDPQEYIVTSSGNRISRTAVITKPQNLEIPSGRVIIKHDVQIDGENTGISINKYTIIGEGTKLCPSSTLEKPGQPSKYIPMTIGSHCYVGKHCLIESAVLGVGCYIGDYCVLSSRTILKDFVYVDSYTFIPPDMVIPPLAIVRGNPAKIVGDMSESITTLAYPNAVLRYRLFKASNDPSLDDLE
jgi:carbonic anhydrase/acetyltransferase-like protein (isoleucine patch superfamily)